MECFSYLVFNEYSYCVYPQYASVVCYQQVFWTHLAINCFHLNFGTFYIEYFGYCAYPETIFCCANYSHANSTCWPVGYNK